MSRTKEGKQNHPELFASSDQVVPKSSLPESNADMASNCVLIVLLALLYFSVFWYQDTCSLKPIKSLKIAELENNIIRFCVFAIVHVMLTPTPSQHTKSVNLFYDCQPYACSD